MLPGREVKYLKLNSIKTSYIINCKRIKHIVYEWDSLGQMRQHALSAPSGFML